MAVEFFLQSSTTSIAGVSALLLFIYYLLFIAPKNTAKKKAAPEAGGAWPVIGHLHLLAGKSQLPHVTLGNMADKYGPIFTMKLGVHRALVVSNWEIAKECFTTNDLVFANRPRTIAMEHLGYNFAMFAFSPYGPYWRQLRKIATLELLTHHRLEMLNHIQESEVRSFTKEIYEQWAKNEKNDSYKVQMEMKRWFGDVTINVIVRMVAGKRYVEANTDSREDEEGDRWQKALRDFFHFLGIFTVSDALPFLRWLDLGGYEMAMKKTAKDMDSALEGWLEEHKRNRISGEVKGEQDFMDAMLSILEEAGSQEAPRYDADTINKATCVNLILGGADSTKIALTWALSLLLNNRYTLKKAQDELDLHIGRERRVKESDVKNLVYLQAIIKETLRLYPVAPLAAPREAINDCYVGGFHVPAGTQLYANLHKIHRDPRVWSDPCEFQPERFLSTHKDVDVKGQHFELIPFGTGRRVCPGISLALQVVQFTLASLLHGFEITTPLDEAVDMSGSSGLSNLKATPLDVLLTPRLPNNLYG